MRNLASSQFQVVPIGDETFPRIQQAPCLPPKTDVDLGNYHYHPCPPDADNPCLQIAYLHSLLAPGHTHQHKFWTRRTPKKLRETLRYRDDEADVVGYGVHVVEGPSYLALAVLAANLLVLSFVLGLAYSLRTGDVSSGFTLASFLLAAEATALTMITTLLFASLSYDAR